MASEDPHSKQGPWERKLEVDFDPLMELLALFFGDVRFEGIGSPADPLDVAFDIS
jgi:hypothetical protein